jgi:hypothetical protein
MLPKNVKELMNGVVDILLTSLNEVLRVEINAAAASSSTHSIFTNWKHVIAKILSVFIRVHPWLN